MIKGDIMAAVDRAYTSEYYYVAPSNYAEEFVRQMPSRRKQYIQEESVRERSQVNKGMEVLPQTRQGNLISQAGLLRAIVILVVLGALLIGSVWMTAKAADIKYSINKVNKESVLLEDEIDLLRIKIESANGIEAVEAYAINEMGMKYPRADQCIYIEKDAVVREDLVSLIKQKAYQ